MNETAFLLYDEQDHLLDSAPTAELAHERAAEYTFPVVIVDTETDEEQLVSNGSARES